ncbi:MAG: Ig-like domain-containing protein, partial [Psychrosphaera sp.]|nr:Ig-like domain-containing protein [Psychrosphaera sp.]
NVTINAAPVATDDSSSLTTGSTVSVNVLNNDTDDGTLQAGTVTVVDAPSNGTATANADGTITYAPTSGFVGSDSFTYTVMDDLNVVSNVATVAITINAVVVPPPTPPASSGGGGSTGPWVLLGAFLIWFSRQRKGVMAK